MANTTDIVGWVHIPDGAICWDCQAKLSKSRQKELSPLFEGDIEGSWNEWDHGLSCVWCKEEIYEPDASYAEKYAILKEHTAAFLAGGKRYCCSDKDMIPKGQKVELINYETLLQAQDRATAQRNPEQDEDDTILVCASCEEGLLEHFQHFVKEFARDWDAGDIQILEYYREKRLIPPRHSR